MNQRETILQFGLTESESTLVKSLTSSFEVDRISLTIQTTRHFLSDFPKSKLCLVIYHVQNKDREDRVIQLIRDFIGPLIPILLLIPPEKRSGIKKYLQAGADDFINLPLNNNQFSISFLVLFEIGQTIAQQRQRHAAKVAKKDLPVYPAWHRAVQYLQAGLSYFSPKSLIEKSHSENIFDRWQLIKRLGLGGFGVVWLVEEIGTKRLAVAKIPHSPQMNIRVLRSAAILKRLVHHPNIVHLIEVVKESGRFILIQEYVQGPTLQKLLEGDISPLDRESYFLQLLSVISYSHKNKILHRDIKPENILIKPDGQLKLLDFGIARDLTWQSADGASEGTVNFMPPEQFRGESCIASDVWALGVILYIFATNTTPYDQQNNEYPVDIETTLTNRSPSSANPGFNPLMEAIIIKCLEKDVNKRYPSATELLSDIQRTFPDFGKGVTLPLFSTSH
ncbi:serine/threonine-protein kinase [Desulforhopalus sp. IMCC35007]|uniref:serine/threonine protein kinase n=1 Tax=Desulforhopalus sp. IMCC35007 TaxID=2569543 RepID=UPI0010AE9C42|nr:serine/threonine-protein kinase [Desulforhopalus sp. IMCC35007]TKB07646.1 serine/threonine protein kinase [Desulforhopalus sp. IMCC35007]